MNLLTKLDSLAGRYLDWRTKQAYEQQQREQDEPELLSFEVTKEKGAEFTMMHPNIAILAADCASYLDEMHAENYVVMEIMPRIDRGQRPIMITIQWKDKLNPYQKNIVLEAENARLREALEKYADETNWVADALGNRDIWMNKTSDGPYIAQVALKGEE